MTTAKHTPTWRAYESAGFKGEWGVETDDPAKAATGDKIIVYPSLSEAEARQIAATPDLIEALKGAIGALEFSRDYHADLSNAEQAFAQDKLDAALAALAKAEGQP